MQQKSLRSNAHFGNNTYNPLHISHFKHVHMSFNTKTTAINLRQDKLDALVLCLKVARAAFVLRFYVAHSQNNKKSKKNMVQ